MKNMSKELLREYVKEQNFSSPNEVLNSLKDLFKDVLQEVLEAEMDEVNMVISIRISQIVEMVTQKRLLRPN